MNNEGKTVTPDRDDELGRWDATETAHRIASREVSPEEVVAAAIERARGWELSDGAIAVEAFESALHTARTSSPRGTFGGVPTFIKDIDDVEGLPTGFGTAARPAHVARKTGRSVTEFSTTGVISLGKSTTSEFGLTATAEPRGRAPARNPHAPDHTCGGSSSGAAGLVSGGIVPIAYASDGGGSIRIPAAWCGLVGLKASRGRLEPLDPAARMPIKLATYGVLTRTVRDTAAFYASIERVRPVSHLPPIGWVRGPSSSTWRIGVYTDSPFGLPVDAEVRDGVKKVAAYLESLGHAIVPVPPPFSSDFLEDFFLYWCFLASGVELWVALSRAGHLDHLEVWTRGLAAEMRANLGRVPGALWRLRNFPRVYQRAFDDVDLLLGPTTASAAPRLGTIDPNLPYAIKRERIRQLLPFTPANNVAGGPALSMPIGTDRAGLPLAAHLSAPMGEERRLLELGYAIEQQFSAP